LRPIPNGIGNFGFTVIQREVEPAFFKGKARWAVEIIYFGLNENLESLSNCHFDTPKRGMIAKIGDILLKLDLMPFWRPCQARLTAIFVFLGGKIPRTPSWGFQPQRDGVFNIKSGKTE
jgi:hypothetical protein